MKKYLFGILAFAFAFAFVAFKPATNIKKQGEFQWFQLKENKTFEHRLDADAYEPVVGDPCQSTSGLLCGIYAETAVNEVEPMIQDDILTELSNYEEGVPVPGYITERDE
ncbi:MAG TPA: hypothetical protein VK483_06155 [Chitinophagaceae bacterium]|nr:hypothetical protein [Chitinophagaceae bacterium]